MLISLVGLPGVGKSTVGRKLARRLEVAFIDSDELVEARIGCAIADYFESSGEAAFRDHEASVLEDVIAGHREAVFATGGGAVIRPGNRRLLRDKTCCVYLESRSQDLLQRLRRGNHRPLFRVADPEGRLIALARERDPLYREAASVVVSAGRSAAATASAVEEAVEAARSSSNENR